MSAAALTDESKNRHYGRLARAQLQGMTERRVYVLDCGKSARESIDAGCEAVFDVVLPKATTATLDGYIGWPDPPADVVAVYQKLAVQHGENHLMGLPFDLSKQDDRTEFLTLAPWSIQAEVADETGAALASIHDASGVVAHLTPAEADLLRQRLGELGHPEIEVVDGDEWDVRHRQRKREERAAAIRRVIDRLRR